MWSRRTVAEVMTAEVVTVRENTSFKRIAGLLADRGVSAVPVVDDLDRVLGVVSESDLLRKEELQLPSARHRHFREVLQAVRQKAKAGKAAGLMTSPAVTVRPEATLPEAARLMARHDITRLLVTSSGALVGIVTRSDLLSVFRESDHLIHQTVQGCLVGNAPWDDPFAVHIKVRDGVVLLSGRLASRSQVEMAVHIAATVDGVVDVVDRLAYDLDDSEPDGARPPAERTERKDLGR